MRDSGMIRFTWDIHYKCNFRCPYCWFFKKWSELSKENIYLSPEEWMVHWSRIYDTYGEARVEIVGGEPFVYPNFIELVRQLSSIHFVKVTTNLSGDIEHFVKVVNPARVEMDLNFHILFIDLETVIMKARILKDAGFRGGICYLAYPPQMYKVKELSERFKKEGINFALAAFWGEYDGRKYPEAYTEEERDLMRPFLGNVDRITYHLNAQSPKGKLCNAGYKYVSIKADGKAVRCGQSNEKVLGNIMDENFKLLDGPAPCEADICPCDEYVNLIDDIGSDGIRAPQEAASTIVYDNDDQDASKGRYEIHPSSPPYRVHWNWELSYSCNYKCSYCPWWHKGGDGQDIFADLGRWREVWQRIFENKWCCHIRFSGGEPTIYPHFFDLVSILLERHTVDITTNLSFEVETFTKAIKPGGISISASFHPEFDEFGPFLEKVVFLHNNGYPSTISYVAYPPHLEKIKLFKSRAEEKRIMFKVIPFNGGFQGKEYPRDYTAQERNLMESLTSDSEDSHLNELNARWYEWNVANDRDRRDKKGRLCRMGQMYAKIYPDGTVARCCAKDKDGAPIGVLGQILDTNFRLLDFPAPCEAGSCPCFKSMLVGFEEDKWLPLWEATEHPIYKMRKEISLASTNSAQ